MGHLNVYMQICVTSPQFIKVFNASVKHWLLPTSVKAFVFISMNNQISPILKPDNIINNIIDYDSKSS